ncbi:hypothetical protein GQ42DRAFT_161804 [Ramicandelaber brevisporus]|nr:hypothetical protein GQ42DRAFT_161804 [Ramicandelaber brevisporus]
MNPHQQPHLQGNGDNSDSSNAASSLLLSNVSATPNSNMELKRPLSSTPPPITKQRLDEHGQLVKVVEALPIDSGAGGFVHNNTDGPNPDDIGSEGGESVAVSPNLGSSPLIALSNNDAKDDTTAADTTAAATAATAASTDTAGVAPPMAHPASAPGVPRIASQSDTDAEARTGVKDGKIRCDIPGCTKTFNTVFTLRIHKRAHKPMIEMVVRGLKFVVNRSHVDDPWPCPFNCGKGPFVGESTLYFHVDKAHVGQTPATGTASTQGVKTRHQRLAETPVSASKSDVQMQTPTQPPPQMMMMQAQQTPVQQQQQQQQQQLEQPLFHTPPLSAQQPKSQKPKQSGAQTPQQQPQQPAAAGQQPNASATSSVSTPRPRQLLYASVRYFEIEGIQCGFHIKTGAFLCIECRLVPPNLQEHLRSRHEFADLTITPDKLPQEARDSDYDPACDQHTANSNLNMANPATAHKDIVRAVVCAVPHCNYCTQNLSGMYKHRATYHPGTSDKPIPAATLRLDAGARGSSHFFVSTAMVPESKGGAAAAAAIAATAPTAGTITPKRGREIKKEGDAVDFESAADGSQVDYGNALNASTTLASAIADYERAQTAITGTSPRATPPKRPQLLPDLSDPLTYILPSGNRVSLSDICSVVNRILTDAQTQLKQLSRDYIMSESAKLTKQTPDDYHHNAVGYGPHLTPAYMDEMTKYCAHLEAGSPIIAADLLYNSPEAVSDQFHSFVKGHDQLLKLIIALIHLTGGVKVNESIIAGLRIMDCADGNRNLFLATGSVLIMQNEPAPAHYYLPQPVAQLLLNYLLLVRRPLALSFFRKGDSELAKSMTIRLCAPAGNGYHGSVSSWVNTVLSDYMPFQVSLPEYQELALCWAEAMKITLSESPQSQRRLYVDMKQAEEWHAGLRSNGASLI